MYFLEFKTKVEVEMVVGFSPRHYVVLLRSLQLLDYPNVFLFIFYMTQHKSKRKMKTKDPGLIHFPKLYGL